MLPTARPTETPVPTPTPTIVPVLRLMAGFVVDVVERNATEIDLLVVRGYGGRIWEFTTEGPIGVDAAHLLVHRDTQDAVEVHFQFKGDRAIADKVLDLPR